MKITIATKLTVVLFAGVSAASAAHAEQQYDDSAFMSQVENTRDRAAPEAPIDPKDQRGIEYVGAGPRWGQIGEKDVRCYYLTIEQDGRTGYGRESVQEKVDPNKHYYNCQGDVREGERLLRKEPPRNHGGSQTKAQQCADPMLSRDGRAELDCDSLSRGSAAQSGRNKQPRYIWQVQNGHCVQNRVIFAMRVGVGDSKYWGPDNTQDDPRCVNQ
jgi:hypothetical protein